MTSNSSSEKTAAPAQDQVGASDNPETAASADDVDLDEWAQFYKDLESAAETSRRRSRLDPPTEEELVEIERMLASL